MLPILATVIFTYIAWQIIFRNFSSYSAVGQLAPILIFFGALYVYIDGDEIVPAKWYLSDDQYQCSMSDNNKPFEFNGVEYKDFIVAIWRVQADKEIDLFRIDSDGDIDFESNLFDHSYRSYEWEDVTDYIEPWTRPPKKRYIVERSFHDAEVSDFEWIRFSLLLTDKIARFDTDQVDNRYSSYLYTCGKLRESRIYIDKSNK